MPRYLFFALVVAGFFHASPVSSSQWPYRQIYPPVNASDDRTPLFCAAVFSFGGDFTSIGVLPGVQIALDYINNEPSILPGYTLHYTLMDSQVSTCSYYGAPYQITSTKLVSHPRPHETFLTAHAHIFGRAVCSCEMPFTTC